jgi:hypothetical protein
MDVAATLVLDGYRQVHQRMRAELERCEPALLHLTPAPETSSIAVLVLHTLGSEGDVLRAVAGRPSSRDRSTEFNVSAADVDRTGLHARLAEADRLLDELRPLITAERLAMTIERPPRPSRSGLGWLIENHGHAREHLAHLELTRQFLQRPAGLALRPPAASVDTSVA